MSKSTMAVIVGGLLISACATPVPTTDQNTNIGNLADVDADPNRIVCKTYQPAGATHAEKICMTAGQWKKKDGESQ